MPPLDQVFASFGWKVHNVDATTYGGVVASLEEFRHGVRDGRPTAIICNSKKGFGSFSDFMNKHKVTVPGALLEQEMELQQQLRAARVAELVQLLDRLDADRHGAATRDLLLREAGRVH